jgi:hypothetical protein
MARFLPRPRPIDPVFTVWAEYSAGGRQFPPNLGAGKEHHSRKKGSKGSSKVKFELLGCLSVEAEPGLVYRCCLLDCEWDRANSGEGQNCDG